MEEPMGAGDALAWRGVPDTPARSGMAEKLTRIRAIRQDIANRHADLVGDGTLSAAALEDAAGTLEDQPSWRNAGDLAKANEGKSWFDTSAKWRLSPERYAYMQEYGRDIDFLRGVEEAGPETSANLDEAKLEKALHYWDRSNSAGTTDDIWGPRYQRFSGWANQIKDGYVDPAVTVSSVLHRMDDAPGILQDLLSGRDAGQSLERANAEGAFNRRYRLGKNPVLDLPSAEPAQDVESYMRQQDEYQQRLKDLKGRQLALQPATGQDVANRAAQALFGTNASRFAGDAAEFGASLIDPSFVASAGTQAAPRAALRKASRSAPALLAASRGAGRALAAGLTDRARQYAEAHARLARSARPTAAELISGAAAAARADAVQDTLVNTGLNAGLHASDPGWDSPSAWLEYLATPSPGQDSLEQAAAEDDERQRAILWMNGQLGTPDVRTGRGVFDPIGSMLGR